MLSLRSPLCDFLESEINTIIIEKIYNQRGYFRSLYRKKFSSLSEHDFENIFHDLIVIFIEKYHTFRGEGNLEVWLTTIFLNECSAFFRRKRKKKKADFIAGMRRSRQYSSETRMAEDRIMIIEALG